MDGAKPSCQEAASQAQRRQKNGLNATQQFPHLITPTEKPHLTTKTHLAPKTLP